MIVCEICPEEKKNWGFSTEIGIWIDTKHLFENTFEGNI